MLRHIFTVHNSIADNMKPADRPSLSRISVIALQKLIYCKDRLNENRTRTRQRPRKSVQMTFVVILFVTVRQIFWLVRNLKSTIFALQLINKRI